MEANASRAHERSQVMCAFRLFPGISSILMLVTQLLQLSIRLASDRLSKLGALVDMTDVSALSLPLGPKPPPTKPFAEGTNRAEGNVPSANSKGKPAGGVKLMRLEKKKSKKHLEAKKKALELREKKMTRRKFIQYSYEVLLKEDLADPPPKRLVLKDKIIWYAKPGTAKASDSFDSKRYEMVFVLCCV